MPTIVDGDFEWDSDKAEANLEKHGVSFDEAMFAFDDPFAICADDGSGRDRTIVIGRTPSGRLLCVVHVERGRRDRIISARVATRRERALYDYGET